MACLLLQVSFESIKNEFTFLIVVRMVLKKRVINFLKLGLHVIHLRNAIIRSN